MRVLKPVAHFTYRARFPLLGLFALLFIGAGIYGAGAPAALTVGGFDDTGSESYRTQQRLEELFDAGHPDVLVSYSHPDRSFTDPAFRVPLEGVIQSLSERPDVEQVGTPYRDNGGALIAKDGRTVVIPISLRGDAAETFEAVSPTLVREPLEVLVGGPVPASIEAQHAAEADLRRAELITLPLLALLLVVFFRGVVAASLPLLIGGFAVLSALAMIRLITHVMEVSIFAMTIVTLAGRGVALDSAL